MSKARKYRRVTGMVLCLLIIISSFFPVVWRKSGPLNFLQIFWEFRDELDAVGLLLIGIQVIFLVTYLIFFFCWIRKVDTIWFRFLAVFVSVVGCIGAEVMAVYFVSLSEISGGNRQLLILVWPVLRCFLGWIESAMKSSGEEFFAVMLKEKK